MKVPTQIEMVAAIDNFLRRHPEIAESRFGRDTTGEPGLVPQLRDGRSLTLRTAEKIADYMAGKDAELADAADHVGDDTTGGPASSSGKAESVSAPPDPPFPDALPRTDAPAPGGSTSLPVTKGVVENPATETHADAISSASPTSSRSHSNMCAHCSSDETATDDAAQVAA